MSRATHRAIHDTFAKAYADEPFIEMLPFGEAPSTHHVRGSNFCHIGVAARTGSKAAPLSSRHWIT